MKKITLNLIALLFCSIIFGQKINTTLEYKVNLPLKKTAKVPVVIMLHGYGSNEADLFDISKSFDERVITFSLRGPYADGSKQGYSWFELNKNEQKEFQINYKETAESRNKILSFISNACKAYSLDSTQVFVMGFSQGAIMCYDLAFSHPGKIKGVLPLSGFILPQTKDLKPKTENLMKTGFFIAHGTQDNVIDFKKGEEAATLLSAKKIPVTFKSYSMPHSICGKELNDIKSWMDSQITKEKKK